LLLPEIHDVATQSFLIVFYANLDVHDLILREWSWLVSGDDWSVEAVFAKDSVVLCRVGDFLRLEKLVEGAST